MTHEITGYEENTQTEESGTAPPLCLVHYFVESLAYPPERPPKPPGPNGVARIAERHGNVIVLEFAPSPETVQSRWQKKRRDERIGSRITSTLFWLLVLVSVIGGFIASRF